MNYDDEVDMENFHNTIAELISIQGSYEIKLLYLKKAKQKLKNYEQWLKRKIKNEL